MKALKQKIIEEPGGIARLPLLLQEINAKKPLIVCGHILQEPRLKESFRAAKIPLSLFSDYKPNPSYEDVCRAVERFNGGGHDAIVAIGGGSALDVAKCAKLFCKMDSAKDYLLQECFDSKIPLIAVPTTAGSGSESTKNAVIYRNGEKQSAAHESMLPDIALLDANLLKTLPAYQKKCTMLDALCQAIESWWSAKSTDESKTLAKEAIHLIVKNMDAYMSGWSEGAARAVMLAANCAGRAINITQTTAPHAMSYKLTTTYGIAHGHAVALCLPKVWRCMAQSEGSCTDPRGAQYLKAVFGDIAAALGCGSAAEAIAWLESLLARLDLAAPQGNPGDVEMLAKAVSPDRLKTPVSISCDALCSMYREIVLSS